VSSNCRQEAERRAAVFCAVCSDVDGNSLQRDIGKYEQLCVFADSPKLHNCAIMAALPNSWRACYDLDLPRVSDFPADFGGFFFSTILRFP
jgi:hypothetical protein